MYKVPTIRSGTTATPANPKHPGWKLSRNCICDTLLTKREGALPLKGFARSLYNWNVRLLRKTQLALHREEKMHENRILGMLALKRVAPEIVVVVRGGIVERVLSSNQYTHAYVADYDAEANDYGNEEARRYLDEAEEIGNQPGMHEIYH